MPSYAVLWYGSLKIYVACETPSQNQELPLVGAKKIILTMDVLLKMGGANALLTVFFVLKREV
jgi:hypothetical protein